MELRSCESRRCGSGPVRRDHVENLPDFRAEPLNKNAPPLLFQPGHSPAQEHSPCCVHRRNTGAVAGKLSSDRPDHLVHYPFDLRHVGQRPDPLTEKGLVFADPEVGSLASLLLNSLHVLVAMS